MNKDDYMTLLLYGDSKVGKTWLGASAPKPLLVIDAEAGGMRFVPYKKITWDPVTEDPPTIGDWDICQVSVTNTFELEAIRRWLISGNVPFKSIVIDSLTEIQSRMKRELFPDGQLRWNDWGQLLTKLEDLVVEFRDLANKFDHIKCMVIITGADEKFSSDERKPGRIQPLLQGAISKHLPYKIDAIGHLALTVDDEGNDRRRLQLGKTDDVYAGNRLGGRVERFVWDPNLTTIYEQVCGGTQ